MSAPTFPTFDSIDNFAITYEDSHYHARNGHRSTIRGKPNGKRNPEAVSEGRKKHNSRHDEQIKSSEKTPRRELSWWKKHFLMPPWTQGWEWWYAREGRNDEGGVLKAQRWWTKVFELLASRNWLT